VDGRAAGELDALVADAAERQALVAVRDLGRAGLTVGVLGSDTAAPAFASRYCRACEIAPDFAREREAYLEALVRICTATRPRVLIPVHDGSIDALRSCRSEVERTVAIALAPEDALAAVVDKSRTFAAASELGIRLPRGSMVRASEEAGDAIDDIGLPVVVKPVQSWIADGHTGRRVRAVAAVDRLAATREIRTMLTYGTEVAVQEWLPGSREALSFIYARGRFWARFAQRAERMLPPLGGNSILRESIPLPTDITPAAERLVETLGLEGYSEIEFRRDAQGRAALMEVNPRLSASVEVAVRSGVPFPRLLYEWAVGERLTEVAGYRVGSRMRWLGGDLSWLRAALSDPGHPDVPPRAVAAGRFLAGFALPSGYDYVDWRDPRPALRAVSGGTARIRRRVLGAGRSRQGASPSTDTDVAVIGAGPYGLSLSAHLSAQGISHEIFGVPMDTWRNHMPSGMYLKSEGFASNLSDPRGEHTLERFAAETGREYGRIAVPISLDTYVRYGCWFQERVVPALDRRLVERVSRSQRGFALVLSGNDRLTARRVVVATGVQAQAYMPPALRDLPGGAVMHTFDHSDPAETPEGGALVIGAGQSALEAAALIRERGGSVRILSRSSKLRWNARPGGKDRSLRGRWQYPESGLGEGRPQWASAKYPLVFHTAPRGWRLKTAFTVLGPSGAWWLRPRFEGRIDALLERHIVSAEVEDGRVKLRCQRPGGEEELSAGRLIAGTGYRPVLDRLAFLDEEIRADIETLGGAPALDRWFEATAPGVFFVGYPAAPSFGPLMRFVFGADFAARRVTRRIAGSE
jgi:cation diffusion facilitator CzcD-associated flavoprotein CzcO/predicted ATP-grasp superfamily ATP-dependent carboligase